MRPVYEDDNIKVIYKEAGEDSEKLLPGLHVASRLDKPVCGLLLFSKSKDTASYMAGPDVIDKTYTALVRGEVEEEGVYEDFLLHDRQKNKVFVVKSKRKGVKEARLTYKREEVLDIGDERFSLVKVKLQTGRTHQIRVQFASRKHPLMGDGKYGSRVKGYIRLICNKMEVTMPDGESKSFEVELPEDFTSC